jgi:hypothetical protein
LSRPSADMAHGLALDGAGRVADQLLELATDNGGYS